MGAIACSLHLVPPLLENFWWGRSKCTSYINDYCFQCAILLSCQTYLGWYLLLTKNLTRVFLASSPSPIPTTPESIFLSFIEPQRLEESITLLGWIARRAKPAKSSLWGSKIYLTFTFLVNKSAEGHKAIQNFSLRGIAFPCLLAMTCLVLFLEMDLWWFSLACNNQ